MSKCINNKIFTKEYIFDLRSPGDLLFRLNSMNGFRELLSTQLISGLIDLGAVVFILAYMFFKSI